LVCLDEKTGIQALEKLFPDKLVKPGYAKRIEHSYKRHGTKNLIAGFIVATGKISGEFYSKNSHLQLCNFLTKLFNTYHTYKQINIMADNYGTHTHLNTCLLVAKFCDIIINRNKLKTKKQRVDFLTSKNKWIVFHFLPTHASWLNQIEIWFSILTRKAIKKNNFTGIQDMIAKLKDYMQKEWNQKRAKPFQWTYKGKVCCA